MRVGREAIRQNPDGVSIEGPVIELLHLAGGLSPDSLRDHDSTSFKQGLRMYQDAVASSPGFIWVTTPGNSREDQIAAGHAYARVNLKVAGLGLAMHPLSQVLQEYTELKEQLSGIHETLNIASPARIQMLAAGRLWPGEDHFPEMAIGYQIGMGLVMYQTFTRDRHYQSVG